jgi:hypothetical protein
MVLTLPLTRLAPEALATLSPLRREMEEAAAARCDRKHAPERD